MDKQYSESVIRDLVACSLDLFEPGMVLIDKEHYLPGKMGTKGFVDILAKDKAGHLVVIEVKKATLHQERQYTRFLSIWKG